ncbi:MAG: transglycosylase domain-containing protein [Propionibacteriaceae bacterium]|nr:transglycosylase domain-containing protein [Propionibacteriaceae bacterium]
MLFFIVSAVGGLLVAGLAVPAAGALSLGAGALADTMATLPTELEESPQAERSKLLDADGNVIAWFYDENRQVVSLEDIAQVMQDAQVAIEDHRFFQHGAIDLTGTLRALLSTSQGVTQGGSSLTQQYVRLVLVEQAKKIGGVEGENARILATENTIARKVRELRYAIAVEKKFDKQTILENYLNIAYYGEGAYGVEAAAKHYFGVSAKDLSLAQAAMLAGLVQNPTRTSPNRHPEMAIERRNNVLDRMLELNLITSAEAAEAKATPWVAGQGQQAKNGCVNANDKNLAFICDYARRSFLTSSDVATTYTQREDLLLRGGVTIETKVNMKIQKKAQSTIAKLVAAKDKVISVITAIQPGTGMIVAMAQSRPKMGENVKKGETYKNYAAGTDMGGAEGFQAGSTFKMFVAAAALKEGFGLDTTYKVPRTIDFKGQTFTGCNGDFTIKKWKVTGSSGTYNLPSAVRHSVNGYFAMLEQAVGVCKSVRMADILGLSGANGETIEDITYGGEIASFTLGAVEISPLAMVTAYGTIAASGERCDPIIISAITTKDGRPITPPDAHCEQVIEKKLANTVAQLMINSFTGGGTSRHAQVPGVEMAGKTGTVDGNKAIWQVAMNPSLAMAAVISYDSDPLYADYWKPRKNNIQGAKVSGTGPYHYIQALSGRYAGGLLLKPVFAEAAKQISMKRFAKGDATLQKGETVSVPSCAGKSEAACRKALAKANFAVGTKDVDSDAPKGTWLGATSPSGKAQKGTMIFMLYSKGPKDTPTPTVPVPPAP